MNKESVPYFICVLCSNFYLFMIYYMNKLTKLIVGSVAAVSLVASSLIVVNAQVGDPELDMAVTWMATNGMTSATNASNFNPAGTLTRDQGSKFFSEYAMTNLCLEPDTARSCSFSDLWSADPTLAPYVTTSCQLGIFNGSNGVFMPTAPLTKAQFVTALVRAVDDVKDESVTPWWRNYHAEALSLGITRETDPWALDRPVTRYEAALMLYRSRVDGCSATSTTTTTTPTATTGDDLSDILADLFGDDDTTTTTPTTTTPAVDTGSSSTTTTTSMCSDGTPLKTVGSSCDDGNAGTVNDRYVDACNCGGDTVVTTPATPVVTTPTTPTAPITNNSGTSSCDANVALNPASPAGDGQEVPGLATTVVALFDVTATAGDLLMDNMTLQRVGLGSDDAVNFVAIYTLDGSRVSNSSSFNNDDEAFISLNPKVTVANGTTQTFVIVAQVGDSNLASNQEFAIRLNEFNGSCDVSVEAGSFEVAAVNAATIEVEEDGSIDDVEVGQMGEEVATFTIDNTDDSDVFITAVTLRDQKNNADDNLANFELHSNGSVLATTAMANGRYVTFQLATPFLIEEGEDEDFEVVADVIDGAGEDIEFIVERALDVSGFDDTFGYGLNADVSGYTSQLFTIEAGDLRFVNHPLPTDQTRFDKDDVTLMEFHIDIDGGSNLILENILFDIYSDTPACLPNGVAIQDVLENIQLVDVTNGGSYNLQIGSTAGGDNCWIEASDSGMSLNLGAVGQDHVFQVVADVVRESDFSAATAAALVGSEFYVELRPTSTDVRIEENNNSVVVTDITPSFLSSESIELDTSALDVDILECGTNENVVNGAYDIELLTFEIETDDVSPITFDELTIAGVSNFDDDHISSVNLYRGVYPTGTLIDSDTMNGANDLDFDSFGDILVPASSTQPMYITIDLIDDNTNIGNVISAEITNVEAEDDDGDDVPFAIFPTTCVANSVTILGAGTLTVSDSQNNDDVEDEKNVLGGETSDWVAAFDLDGTSENIFIEDAAIVVSGAGFDTAVESVTVYGSDKTTILYGPTSVNSNVIDLNNIDLIVPENGGDTIYVKVTANEFDDNLSSSMQSGPFTMSLVIDGSEATGVDSGDNMGAGSTLTSGASQPFYVVPVDISNVQFVQSSGASVKANENGGLTTNTNVGILRITADSWMNSDSSGWDLDLQLQTIVLDESLGQSTTVGSYEIYKVGGTESAYVGTVAGGQITFAVAASTDDFVLEAGEVADFVIEAVGVTSIAGVSDSVGVEIDDLSAGAITYSADDTGINGFAIITDPRLGYEVVNNNAVSDND